MALIFNCVEGSYENVIVVNISNNFTQYVVRQISVCQTNATNFQILKYGTDLWKVFYWCVFLCCRYHWRRVLTLWYWFFFFHLCNLGYYYYLEALPWWMMNFLPFTLQQMYFIILQFQKPYVFRFLLLICVKLILVEGPRTAWLDAKWAGPVQSKHNYLLITISPCLLPLFSCK